ncbi:MAG: phospholipase D family protein, partial [Burkholderiaceae bacterium]
MQLHSRTFIRTLITSWLCAAIICGVFNSVDAHAATPDPMEAVTDYINQHRGIAGQSDFSGLYVLDSGDEALRARAWLVDHARNSIEVQYFIWSTDNIGILAGEALLRAAKRGIKVRVIVDDLLIDAAAQTMLALDKHPNVDIRIYNPKHSVNVPWYKRILYLFADFKGSNQRMHDKTFVVDGKVAITGGRNMADEYFDYSHDYNFRDRDILVLGKAAGDIRNSFQRFWAHPLTEPVSALYDGAGFLERHVTVTDAAVQAHYDKLHAYAADSANFEPAVRQAIAGTSGEFSRLKTQIIWCNARFISDDPGKNNQSGLDLGGGGKSTQALATLLATTHKEVIIQSPYLVLSDAAIEMFRQTIARGVSIRINTNSMAATDNLQAFSGYRNQRQQLLAMGLEIFEFRPDAAVQKKLMQRAAGSLVSAPVFSLHAKTMVVDEQTVYVGTYNLDPRSENINTEVGIVATDKRLA